MERRIGQEIEQDPAAAVIVGYPNYLGCIEDASAVARQAADRHGALLIVCQDPISLPDCLRTPGEHFGGRCCRRRGTTLWYDNGFWRALPRIMFACAAFPLVRHLPGRLVGETIDLVSDRRAICHNAAWAREQDIRREKASSNVCTNQTLMAVTAAIQLGWLGTSGLREVALEVCPGSSILQRGPAGAQRMVFCYRWPGLCANLPFAPDRRRRGHRADA